MSITDSSLKQLIMFYYICVFSVLSEENSLGSEYVEGPEPHITLISELENFHGFLKPAGHTNVLRSDIFLFIFIGMFVSLKSEGSLLCLLKYI